MGNELSPLTPDEEAWQKLHPYLLGQKGFVERVTHGEDVTQEDLQGFQDVLTMLHTFWRDQRSISRQQVLPLWSVLFQLEEYISLEPIRERELRPLLQQLGTWLDAAFDPDTSLLDEEAALEMLLQQILGGPSFRVSLRQNAVDTLYFQNFLYQLDQLQVAWHGKEALPKRACSALFAIEQFPWASESSSEAELRERMDMKQLVFQKIDACLRDGEYGERVLEQRTDEATSEEKEVVAMYKDTDIVVENDVWSMLKKHLVDEGGLLDQLEQGRVIQVELGNQPEKHQDIQDIRRVIDALRHFWRARQTLPRWQLCLLWSVIPRLERLILRFPESPLPLHILRAKFLTWFCDALDTFERGQIDQDLLLHDLEFHMKELRSFGAELRFGQINLSAFAELALAISILRSAWHGRVVLPRRAAWLLMLVPLMSWDASAFSQEESQQLEGMKRQLYALIDACFCEGAEIVGVRQDKAQTE
ncbi:MAG: hypothetical protein H0W02_01820 [Ktedonobacteraceae bacterium]|nr:hypothetical protein [Ktedonobacteraceae bacterium]